MKRILVICTCNNYWKRFATCCMYWDRAIKEHKAWYLSVATMDGNSGIDTHPFKKYTMMQNHGISKSGMIRETIIRSSGFYPTHYLFTDADIVVPGSLLEDVSLAPDDAYIVADRIDLTEIETRSLMAGCPSPHVERKPNIKKRGMGWFQMLPVKEFTGKIHFKLPWGHNGYDLFDWMINDIAIKAGMPQYVLPSVFMHMYHGNDGANWKGASQEW